MKKCKKIIVVVIAAIMLVCASVFPAAAKAPAGDSPAAPATYCASGDKITWYLAQSIADNANHAIEALVTQAQQCKRPNIRLLILETEIISRTAISLVRTLGYDAVCVYEEYEIGGQIVEIDPIIVIKR